MKARKTRLRELAEKLTDWPFHKKALQELQVPKRH
jgi:hypothetical protein